MGGCLPTREPTPSPFPLPPIDLAKGSPPCPLPAARAAPGGQLASFLSQEG